MCACTPKSLGFEPDRCLHHTNVYVTRLWAPYLLGHTHSFSFTVLPKRTMRSKSRCSGEWLWQSRLDLGTILFRQRQIIACLWAGSCPPVAGSPVRIHLRNERVTRFRFGLGQDRFIRFVNSSQLCHTLPGTRLSCIAEWINRNRVSVVLLWEIAASFSLLL